MSPQTMRINKDTMSFPRPRGDEPKREQITLKSLAFSPPTRG